MITPSRTLLVASAFVLVSLQSPANARGIDPSVDYGSLKAEFAAEDAGASYGVKSRDVRRGNRVKRRGFSTRRRNFGTRRKRN